MNDGSSEGRGAAQGAQMADRWTRWDSRREILCWMAHFAGLACADDDRIKLNAERDRPGHGIPTSVPAQHRLRVQRHLQQAARKLRRRQADLAPAPAEQLFTLILSNNEFSTSTTATVTRRSSSASPKPTPTQPLSSDDDHDPEFSSSPEQVWPGLGSTSIPSSHLSRPTQTSGSVTDNTSSRSTTRTKVDKPSLVSPAPHRTPLRPDRTRITSSTTRSSTRENSSTTKSRTTSSKPKPRKTVTVCASRVSVSSAAHSGEDKESRVTGTSQAKVSRKQERNNDGSVRTIYDYDCSSKSTSTDFPSTSPSSTLSPVPTTSVNPIPAVPALPKADPDESTAFFATSAGKGTIAGITLGSAALSVLLVCLVLWRRKQSRDSGTITIGNKGSGFLGMGRKRVSAASSTSSFGTSSDNLIGVAYNDHLSPDDPRLAAERQDMTETLAVAGATRGFVVESRVRSAPPSSNGHTSNELGATSSSGHDPFADPSSSSHGHSNDGLIVGAGAVGAGRRHERKRSGYTADTYRRRSRPLSVRNPDSDETMPDVPIDKAARSGPPMAQMPSSQPTIGFIPASPESKSSPSAPWQPWQQPGSYSGSHATQGHSHPAASSIPYLQHNSHSLPDPSHNPSFNRTSLSDTDGRSSRSSLVFNPSYFGNNNRSWVNDGVGTPVDVQDVQLGSSVGAIPGSSTETQGYFLPR